MTHNEQPSEPSELANKCADEICQECFQYGPSLQWAFAPIIEKALQQARDAALEDLLQFGRQKMTPNEQPSEQHEELRLLYSGLDGYGKELMDRALLRERQQARDAALEEAAGICDKIARNQNPSEYEKLDSEKCAESIRAAKGNQASESIELTSREISLLIGGLTVAIKHDKKKKQSLQRKFGPETEIRCQTNIDLREALIKKLTAILNDRLEQDD